MKGKMLLLAGVGIGYVLGTRAGRGQYEQLKRRAKDVWGSDAVQEQVANAQQAVRDQAPVVQEKVVDVAKAAAEKAREKASVGSHRDVQDPAVNI